MKVWLFALIESHPRLRGNMTITSSYLPSDAAARAVTILRSAMRGEVVVPGDGVYPQPGEIWNAPVAHEPALIAVCETTDDIRAAMREASENRLPLSVHGGGRVWAARASRPGGMIIDLSRMRNVEIDPQAEVAIVAGGARAADVIAAAAPHGLVAVTGNSSTAGITGFTLGGGYGLLSSRFGLGIDNLIEAEVVLHGGELVTASASENMDLFWALRGGGGNFGVVASMRIRLHRVEEILSGAIFFPWEQAEAVLGGYAGIAASEPDESSTLVCIVPGPERQPLLMLAPFWTGDRNRGDQAIERLTRLGAPIVANIGRTSYADVLAVFDAHALSGRNYTARTRWLPNMTPGVISSLIEAANARTSPWSVIASHHFHGAATRISSASTAFSLRRRHFMVELIGAWESGAEQDADVIHDQWADEASHALVAEALPGGYPNLLGPDQRDQIPASYGSNGIRLRILKRRYDPENLFSPAPSLPV
jgi:FAD/FMN-containing dehydrogenase